MRYKNEGYIRSPIESMQTFYGELEFSAGISEEHRSIPKDGVKRMNYILDPSVGIITPQESIIIYSRCDGYMFKDIAVFLKVSLSKARYTFYAAIDKIALNVEIRSFLYPEWIEKEDGLTNEKDKYKQLKIYILKNNKYCVRNNVRMSKETRKKLYLNGIIDLSMLSNYMITDLKYDFSLSKDQRDEVLQECHRIGINLKNDYDEAIVKFYEMANEQKDTFTELVIPPDCKDRMDYILNPINGIISTNTAEKIRMKCDGQTLNDIGNRFNKSYSKINRDITKGFRAIGDDIILKFLFPKGPKYNIEKDILVLKKDIEYATKNPNSDLRYSGLPTVVVNNLRELGINKLVDVEKYTRKEIANAYGIGKYAMTELDKLCHMRGVYYKKA